MRAKNRGMAPSKRGLAVALLGLLTAVPGATAAPSATSVTSVGGSLTAAADASVAVSPDRIVILVNERFVIRRRDTGSEVALTLRSFSFGVPPTGSDVMWDDRTQRFYYVITSKDGTNSFLNIGWSRTATPTGETDWCRYRSAYSLDVLQNPVLGDTSNRLLIGVNRVNRSSGVFVDADLHHLRKPDPASDCQLAPPPGTTINLRLGTEKVRGPAPATQIDDSSNGYVVARPASLPDDRLLVIRASETRRGAVNLTYSTVATDSFAEPPDLAQKSSTQLLDTGAAEFAQTILARVPRHANDFSLFTQHTVADGTGAAVEWFELDPTGTAVTIRRSGRLANGFSGAIASNRRYGVATSGDDFAIVFNRSAADIFPRIRVASSIDGAALTTAQIAAASAPLFRATTAGPYAFGGATAVPDPASATIFVASELPAGTGTAPAFTDPDRWQARVFQITP